jgi:hypothetical protein
VSSPSFQLATPLCIKWFYWLQFEFRKPPIGRINSLENWIPLAALIWISRSKLMLNEYIGVATEWIMSSTITTSRISHRNTQFNTSTNYTVDVLPRLKFLSAITAFTPLTVFLIKSFTANKIYLHGARWGFEPESQVHIRAWTWNAGAYQGLNPKCRYISGLEPEMPVHIRAWTWNAGNITYSYIERHQKWH